MHKFKKTLLIFHWHYIYLTFILNMYKYANTQHLNYLNLRFYKNTADSQRINIFIKLIII